MRKIRRSISQLAAGAALLTIGALVPPAAAQTNVLQNPDFEAGTSGWFGFGSVSFTTPTGVAHAGSRAAYIQNRTATWNGVAQSLLGVLQSGNTYKLSAWVRLANADGEPIKLTIVQTDGSGTKYLGIASSTGTSNGWTQLAGAVTMSFSGSVTTLTLYVEGPAVGVNLYADDFSVTDYAWKELANARIEQIRKRDAHLQVIDPAGHLLSGVNVAIRQRRHRFAFGSAINSNISNPNYAAFFRTNFEWAVMENQSKWAFNEPSQSNITYTAADAITNYCYTNGITMRGHCLFWGVSNSVQSWVMNLSNSNLLAAVQNRINSAVPHFRGTFLHWDVNNEMLHGNYYGNRLGNWINPWMFQQAQALDANLRLFVNDYNVVSGSETDAYKQQILDLIASNAPVAGLGAQGHFGTTISPYTTETRLDSLAELGIPIWITEYDSSNSVETVRADNLEILYRLAFSKSAVDGVLMWGFWAGSHWRGSNAAIVNLNWSLNEAGRRYQSLLAEWTTVTNGTSTSGGYSFRGFHGDYDIVLTAPGGQPALRRITLEPGAGTGEFTVVLNPSDSRPFLHSPSYSAATRRMGFLLTADAGKTYEVQGSTNLPAASPSAWVSVTNMLNPSGTVPVSLILQTNAPVRYFRARTLP